MDEAASAPEPDFESLAKSLQVLANPNRLRLLHLLQEPKAAGDIALAPGQVGAGENPDRPMSRPAVREHLDRLASLGLIETRPTKRDNVLVEEFVVEHRRLFALAEDFRALTRLRPREDAGLGSTLAARGAEPAPDVPGPRLVLVSGPHEAKVVPLVKPLGAPERGWVIGRKPGIDVSLDYDPFASGENAEIVTAGGGAFRVLDIRSSRNGTFLNWRRLPRGGEAPLRTGDVVGVGRTLLLFRSD